MLSERFLEKPGARESKASNCSMVSDEFFHPDHAVPFIEFSSAVIKCSYGPIAHMTVEIPAVVCEVSVFFRRHSDARVKVDYPHLFEPVFQCFIKLSS